jgi:hypothetical protein
VGETAPIVSLLTTRTIWHFLAELLVQDASDGRPQRHERRVSIEREVPPWPMVLPGRRSGSQAESAAPSVPNPEQDSAAAWTRPTRTPQRA